jgi:hypothetical protein
MKGAGRGFPYELSCSVLDTEDSPYVRAATQPAAMVGDLNDQLRKRFIFNPYACREVS